ncbi:plasmid replication protein RepC [Paracoccus sp. Z330]|uniref:Plasmid replication protein RepC n=1 Tax=Paracoccus onchidii TaxID=3017813 RepID=A0ABT4ZK01_9RHOB|nr:plasmid replication protein RepC [Paracoccus onchidii]MDB6179524.1 plasmid replication protein RepC [Paracoccus onchidii]
MTYHAIAPFGRMIDPAQMQEAQELCKMQMPAGVDKWQLLRELSVARKEFGLSDRDLTVLQALLSFYPSAQFDMPDRMIIHASNATICERLHGMPCSTMRRHLAKLVDSGLLIRRDSPNGKRYVRRTASGNRAFGIDLTPLPHLFEHITQTAARIRAEAAELGMQRETASLMRRDLINALQSAHDLPTELASDLSEVIEMSGKALRRKQNLKQVNDLKSLLSESLDLIGFVNTPSTSEQLSTNQPQNEQHIQNTNKDYFESSGLKNTSNAQIALPPLDDILSSCKEMQTMTANHIENWDDFHTAAEHLYPAMGIGSHVWFEAKKSMGLSIASLALAAILERFNNIRSPSAYMRTLAAKAAKGQFSIGPMIKALARPSCQTSSQL